MHKALIIAICIVSATGYGVIHDEITARMSVGQCFTIAHPAIFASHNPAVLGICWSITTTLGIGLVFWRCCWQEFQPPRIAARAGFRHLAFVAHTAGGYGYFHSHGRTRGKLAIPPFLCPPASYTGRDHSCKTIIRLLWKFGLPTRPVIWWASAARSDWFTEFGNAVGSQSSSKVFPRTFVGFCFERLSCTPSRRNFFRRQSRE